MTAFNPTTDLPSQINTLESLAAWVIHALATINPNDAILEDRNRDEFVAQAGIVKAADGTERLIGRLSIEMDIAYKSDRSKKLWMFAQEFGNTALPAAFKTN